LQDRVEEDVPAGPEPRVAIVDYGLGNLFSVKQACVAADMAAAITSDRGDIAAADAVILPGVGAFGDAMAALRKRDLIDLLCDLAAAGKPLVGICLGLQLIMESSTEFGDHDGLGIVPGHVEKFTGPREADRVLKVPQVGWNYIHRPEAAAGDSWEGTPLAGVEEGCCMYFVHSFYVVPDDPAVLLSMSRYGDIEFCSSLRFGSVSAFQYHPERSGEHGLQVYRNLSSMLKRDKGSV
jgi:imidazole glycerol-phosphate synthase subunit HisH